MHSLSTLSLLALAGSALAAPAPHHRKPNKVVYHTVVETVYATVVYGQPTPTPAPEPIYTPAPQPEAPKPSSAKEEVVVITSAAPAPVEPTPEPSAPAPVESAPAPEATNAGYMAIVDTWRNNLGLSALQQDSTLEANAAKTAREGNGQMVHQLNPGSFAQVLAPGQPDQFEHVFVGGWLCERPDMSGMNGICKTASEGWMYTSTGHADILTSGSYSKIGCGCEGGIWACDLA